MSDARTEILRRVRAALADRPETVPEPPPSAASPRHSDGSRSALAERFAERVADYRATVTRCAPQAVERSIADILGRHGASRVLRPGDIAGPVTADTFADVDGVITACRLAIAETGTIVLDAGDEQGPRMLTLLPDLHVCVVHAAQIVADVPDAIRALAGTTRPITFISGPSATSDIELERVEGVHGPRRLEVLLTD